mmetsp:Transcript_42253/g.135226  ORF Transcript_42253/g.135226 Transcript_42253/m.135226 type:complete len:208 (+) Transcript_42253:787-1410(+)
MRPHIHRSAGPVPHLVPRPRVQRVVLPRALHGPHLPRGHRSQLPHGLHQGCGQRRTEDHRDAAEAHCPKLHIRMAGGGLTRDPPARPHLPRCQRVPRVLLHPRSPLRLRRRRRRWRPQWRPQRPGGEDVQDAPPGPPPQALPHGAPQAHLRRALGPHVPRATHPHHRQTGHHLGLPRAHDRLPLRALLAGGLPHRRGENKDRLRQRR